MRAAKPSDSCISRDGTDHDGIAFLVEERRPNRSIEMCEKLVSEGSDCLLISRDPAEQVLGKSFLEPKRTIWLTNMVGKDRMNPTAIGMLMGEIKRFIEQSERAVVLIDGMEFLISINTYDRMLQFVHQLRDIFVLAGAVLILPLDTRTLSDREIALLERNLQVMGPSSDGEPPEALMEIQSGGIVGSMSPR